MPKYKLQYNILDINDVPDDTSVLLDGLPDVCWIEEIKVVPIGTDGDYEVTFWVGSEDPLDDPATELPEIHEDLTRAGIVWARS